MCFWALTFCRGSKLEFVFTPAENLEGTFSMKLSFLNAPVPLTKSYTKLPDGSIEKSSYPNVWEVTSIAEDCPTLAAMEKLITKHAALGNCLLKGLVQRPLTSESRKGSTDRNAATDWLCLDIDGIEPVFTSKLDDGTITSVKVTPDTIMDAMGLADVSYILQWSGSMNITSTALRCHIFVMLTKPVSAPLVKQWLIQKNHEVTILRHHQALTKTGNSLTWGLDVTACQSDKLIYIAPPVLKGIKNPLGKIPRISLIAKAKPSYDLSSQINSTAQNRALTDTRVLALRDQAGLPKRKLTYKTVGAHEILIKPDTCIATETKQDRGFVYFNLNGGDSWAYYHPEDNPDYIHNFKGEPVYLTKELLPDYWASLQSAGHRVTSSGLTYLAFCDRLTGTYWKGTYDATQDLLDITIAKTLVILKDYAKENGMPLGDFVPEWDMSFDPQDNVRVDFTNKTINTFQLTPYMKAVAKKVTACPPGIFRVVHHALGGDADITEHFINWVAYILQERDRTLTAWVLHGTQGTGKGILMSRILRPLFGANQTTVRRMEEFKQPYNSYMKQCFLVFVDEVQTKALMDENGIMANIKNFITEPIITIRQMYASAVECRNYTNWIFASNKPDPIQIDREDRRTNVGRYQPAKLVVTDKDLAKIESELQAFHDFLLGYAVDKAAAATPLETEDRDTLISISENAIDSVASALIEGDMEFFVDQLPTSNKYQSNALAASKVEDYRQALHDILLRTDALTGKVNIPRDELRTLFEYTVGKIPESPNKFTSLLKHHRIHMKKVWGGDKTVNGTAVEFKDVQNFGKYLNSHFPQLKKLTKAKP